MRSSHLTAPSWLCVVALSVALTACGDESGSDDPAAASQGQLTVVASTNVWGDVAAQVAGELADVAAIVEGASQDPHSYEATPQDLLAISEASVVIANGGGYDEFMDIVLDGGQTEATVLAAAEISGLSAEDGEELNEHFWYDLPSVQKVATAVADELAGLDPDNAAAYADNLSAFNASVEELITTQEAVRADISGLTVGVTEPLPIYLSDAVGLTNVTPEAFSEAVEEGDDVSVAVLKETLDTYADGEVDLLLYNEQTAGPVTEQVREAAEDAGVPVVSVTETLPDGQDYLSWMQGNIDAIAAATASSR